MPAATKSRVKRTSFKPGTPKPPGSGRKKGQRNRVNILLKDAIIQAATLVGQDGRGRDGLVGYLKSLAIKERAVYARLLERVLPMQISVQDKTTKVFTAEEAVQRLQARGLPVPISLLQLAQTIGTSNVQTLDDEYEDELNGIGFEAAGEGPAGEEPNME
jgi:phage-related holin